MVLSYISGPLVGAVIGYCTNYIAVKMLFRPYNAKFIGKKQVPFTPGIIPKRQNDMARAVGNAVGRNLFTGEDLQLMLLSEETDNKLVSAVTELWNDAKKDSVRDLFVRNEKADAYEKGVNAVVGFISERITSGINSLDWNALVRQEGRKFITEKKASLGMLAMFLNENMFEGILSELGAKAEAFAEDQGPVIAEAACRSQIGELGREAIEDWLHLPENKLEELCRAAYRRLVVDFVGTFLQQLDIASVVEEKVAAMDVKELERLCLSVMEKELNAIIRLGALIGLVIGIINVFI